MTVPGLVGIDPLALDDLLRLLERTADQLLEHRMETERLLVQLGMSPDAARRLREVEDWLQEATAQARWRRNAVEPPAAPPRRSVPKPKPASDGAVLLATRTGRPVFANDSLSGK